MSGADRRELAARVQGERPLKSPPVGLEIFVQRFRHGDGCDADASAVLAALEPYLDHSGRSPRLRVGDADGELYGLEDLASGFMVAHAGGAAILGALVAVARACDLVILPVGCPTAITDERQRSHLPAELADEAVLVTSGEALQRLIETA